MSLRRSPARRSRQPGFIAAITLVVIAMAAALLAVPQPAHAADEFDTLRGKWNALLTGAGAYDPADPDIARRISTITADAQRWWSAMDTTPGTYLWSDLASTTASDQITAAYNRIRSMALGYATFGSPVYRDPALRADLHTALDWMHANRYNAGKSEYGNWWDWEIGAPLALTDTMVMLYDQLTAPQFADNLGAIRHFQPSVTMTGANRVWESTIIALCGILGKDATLVATGRDGLNAVLPYVATGDGFYVDGSFIQHDKYSYLGGYGIALLENLAKLLSVLQGSSWAVTSPHLGSVWRWVYDTVEPLIYKGAVLDMTRGRDVSRPVESEHGNGHVIIRSVLLLAQAAPPADAAAYQAMVKYWIQADTHLSFFTSAPIFHIVQAKAILADSGISARPVLTASRQFAGMGQAIHRRPGYAYAISMSSNRTANYESINNENLKGWYTGDGETFLYTDDLGQFSGDYQPTIDPYRRPGTTVDTGQVRADGSGYGYLSPRDWAGGTTLLGTYGAAGMDLDAYGNTLVAKKSWFMFDDEIVALGAGITSTDNRTIETTVENRTLTAAGDNAFVVDGVSQPTTVGWSSTAVVGSAHLAGNVPGSDIGYYFPGGQTVQMRRQARAGTWASINKLFPDSTPRSANYLTMSVSHGTNPSGVTYAYVLLPGRSAAQTAAYAQSPGVVVLANTAAVQAVRQTQLGIVGANFWTDAPAWVQVGGTNFASSDRRASLLAKESSAGLDVSVADPTQSNTGTISIEINRPAFGILSHDPRIVVTQLSPTIKFTADVAGARGKPLEVSFGSTTGVPMDVNLALRAPTAASSSYTGTSAWGGAKTTDGERQSLPGAMGWSSNNSLTANHSEWIRYDLGAVTSVNAVDLFAMRFGNESSFPRDVRVDVSTDAMSWTSVATRTSIPIPGIVGLRIGFPSTNARYVRVVGTSLRPNPYDGDRYRMQLAEVEIRSVNLALARPVSASSSYPGAGWGTAKAVDGARASAWPSYGWSSNATLTANHPEWITVDLGAAHPVGSVVLTPVTVNGGYGFPPDFRIEVSADGLSWSTMLSRSGYPVPTTAQTFTFPSVGARYVRITGTSLRPNPQDLNLYRMQFAEIEIR